MTLNNRVIVIKENLLRTYLPFLNKTPTLIVVRSDQVKVKVILIVFQLYFPLITQTIAENVVGLSNLEWLVEVSSPQQFSSLLAEADLPIDSSLYYYSGDPSHRLTLHDVYRPAPYLDLRSGMGNCEIVRV